MSASCTYTTTNGTPTHFTQTGTTSGRLLFLLHGLGGSSKTFLPLLPHLAIDRYNVINVDLEGFGKTPLPREDTTLSIKRYVSDLGDLISHLSGDVQVEGRCNPSQQPVVIIGHSLGSIIALHYAATHPGRVAGLGLLGVGRAAPAGARERMLDLAEKVRREGIEAAANLASITNFGPDEAVSDATRKEVRAAVAVSDPEAYARTCEAIVSSHHTDPEYNGICCPVTFVSGQDDRLSPPERANQIRSLLGGPTEVAVVKGGHQPLLSDPVATFEALVRLLGLVESSATANQ